MKFLYSSLTPKICLLILPLVALNSLYICYRNLFLDQDKNFFHNPFVGHCMDSLGISYMLITSGSLRVKQQDVIHCHLNFTQVRNILDISIP